MSAQRERETLSFYPTKIDTLIGEEPWCAETYRVRGHFTMGGSPIDVEVWTSGKSWAALKANIRPGSRCPLKATITFDSLDRSTYTADVDGKPTIVMKICGDNGRRVVTKSLRAATTPTDACRLVLQVIEGSSATEHGDVFKLARDDRHQWVRAIEALREALEAL